MILTFNECKEQIWQIGSKGAKKNAVAGTTAKPSNFITLYSNRSRARIDINVGEKPESIKQKKLDGSTLIYQEPDRMGTLYKGDIRVKYSNKQYAPFIAGDNDSRGTNMIAVSLDVTNVKLTSFYTKGAYVLSSDFEPGKHLDFVALIPAGENSISIVLQDEEQGKVHSYRFVYNTKYQRVNVYTKSLLRSEIPPKGERGHINTANFCDRPNYRIPVYRPGRPTHAIICANDDIVMLNDILKNTYKVKFDTQHTINGYGDESEVENIVDGLKSTYFTAVTFYSPIPYDEIKDETTEGKIVSSLMEKFATVFVVDVTGALKKVQY